MSLLLGLQSLLHHQRLYHKFFLTVSRVRIFSSQAVSSAKERDKEEINTFKEIYRFKYIPLGHVINKFKWPQTLIAAITIPSSAVLYFCGIIDVGILIAILLPCITITGNVYTFGELFNKAVGFMYLSEDESTVKISYLDYWGARVNKEFPVGDIMPLADCPRTPTDILYRTIHVYSTDKLKMKLFLYTGGIVTDKNRFVRVFGDYKKF